MIYPPLKRRDRALARTNVKFRRPYKLETTLDLEVLVLMARCEASLEKAWTASLPQAPYDSTTWGMQVHPSSEHLASLAEYFLISAATAADPAVRPASERRDGFSGECQRQQALPQSQFEAKMLRMCGGCTKLVHGARSTPPSLALDELHAFDQQVRHTFTESQAIHTTDSSWKQAQLSLSRGGLGLRSLAHHSTAAFIASISTAGLPSPSDNFLVEAVNVYNMSVPPESAVDVDSLATTPCRQHTLSATLESTQFNSLLTESSTADKARLLSVSLPHASAWLSAVPSLGLGLSPDRNEHQMAIKWWLGLDTSPGSPPCALCPEHPLDPLGHHALTCKRGGGAVSRHKKFRCVVLQTCHRGRSWQWLAI